MDKIGFNLLGVRSNSASDWSVLSGNLDRSPVKTSVCFQHIEIFEVLNKNRKSPSSAGVAIDV